MLDAVARRLESGRPGSRFPLLQLLRREGPVSAPECGALAFEVSRLEALLSALPCEGDEPADAREGAEASAAPAPRTAAHAFARPLRVLAHFARLGAASGDGLRVEAATAESSSPLALPVPHA
jgi:hypothetical protein